MKEHRDLGSATEPGAPTPLVKSKRVYIRKFDHDDARRRYVAGESVAGMALEFGVSATAVLRVVSEGTRRSEERTHARIAASGRCDRCGGSMNGLSRYHGSVLCVECARDDLATNVRVAELRCTTCQEWKPDDAFPYNQAQSGRHRGRHKTCRTCLTLLKRDYRARNREKSNTYDRAYRARRRQAAA